MSPPAIQRKNDATCPGGLGREGTPAAALTRISAVTCPSRFNSITIRAVQKERTHQMMIIFVSSLEESRDVLQCYLQQILCLRGGSDYLICHQQRAVSVWPSPFPVLPSLPPRTISAQLAPSGHALPCTHSHARPNNLQSHLQIHSRYTEYLVSRDKSLTTTRQRSSVTPAPSQRVSARRRSCRDRVPSRDGPQPWRPSSGVIVTCDTLLPR